MTTSNTVKQSTVTFENTEIAFGNKSKKELDFSIWLFRMMQRPALVNFASKAALLAIKMRFPITGIVKATIFKQFCGGETISECDQSIIELGKANIGAILDYSVEGANEEDVFDRTTAELIRNSDKAASSPHIPVTCMKVTGVARFNLLKKLSANEELTESERAEYGRVFLRVRSICERAAENQVPIYIDAEETWIQPAIDRMAESLMRQYNKERAIVFTTMQMYRWDQLDHLKKLIQEAQAEGFVAGVKFVRGAYLEKENARAKEMGYKTPMQPNKESTDNDYNEALKLSIDNLDNIEFCAGTHNEKSSLYLTELILEKGLEKNIQNVYFSQLYGMSDHISYNLANAGYNVSKYLPYGPVKDAMPYLIRRAEENTAIAGQMGKELSLLIKEKERRTN